MNNVQIDDLSKIDAGFLKVCEGVSRTLGAEGKLAILEAVDPLAPPTITKDGVSVANKIRFEDKEHNFGAFLARQVALKTLQLSGDSTSTSLVFSKSFLQNFPNRKWYNKAVERGLNVGYKEALELLSLYSTPVDEYALERIAVVASNNDEELGKIIIEAYKTVGMNGIVEVKKAQNTSLTTLDVSNGMKINSGYKSPFFINNNVNATWEGQNVLVAVLEVWMSDEAIKQFIQDNRYNDKGELQAILLVMEKCEDISFVMDLENFAMKSLYNVCLTIAPDVEKFKKITHLNDIALYTGAEVYRPEGTIKAGKVDSVICNHETTTIINKNLSDKVAELITELKSSENQDDFTRNRIQRLESVSCTIMVGGHVDTEIDERFDRVDDSLKSTKSAIHEGYIAGGGSALAFISGQMRTKFKNGDEQMGYNLIKKVLQEPMRQIIKNANRKTKENFWQFFRTDYIAEASKVYGMGYNAKTDKLSSLIDDGVLDSARSIRIAFDNAKAVSEKLLSSAVVVTFTN